MELAVRCGAALAGGAAPADIHTDAAACTVRPGPGRHDRGLRVGRCHAVRRSSSQRRPRRQCCSRPARRSATASPPLPWICAEFPTATAATTPAASIAAGWSATCSRSYGRPVPRLARDQYDAGKRVSRDEVRAGDLVFFSTNGVRGLARRHRPRRRRVRPRAEQPRRGARRAPDHRVLAPRYVGARRVPLTSTGGYPFELVPGGGGGSAGRGLTGAGSAADGSAAAGSGGAIAAGAATGVFGGGSTRPIRRRMIC